MKKYRSITTGILAAGVLLLLGSAQLHAQNLVVAGFATGTQGENNSQDGSNGQWGGDDLSVPYGAGTIAWDGITFDAADGSTGSAHITANFSSANNTDVLVSMAPGYNNWYYNGSGGTGVPGWDTGTVDFTKYHAVQFDILWDTNSTLTIDQFNTGSNWPAAYLTNGLVNYMATNSYYTAGVNVQLFTGVNGSTVPLATFQIPAAASNGWQTVTVPYSDALSGITAGAGLWFEGAFGGGADINGGPYTASFWIDNLVLVTNQGIALPPKLSLSTAAQGLNLFTDNGGNINNRQSLQTVNTNINYSWVNAVGPVSYSFTISSYPVPKADQVGTYIFLIPKPGTEAGADYNEPNVMFLDLESTSTGASCLFRYKTNEPSGNAMIYGSGTLATINTSTAIGTWTLTFSNNTNVTMSGPGGASTNFSIPDATGATPALFASNVVIYFGGQANNGGAVNDHFVASDFNVTGLGSTNFDDNFVADAGVLNTNLWKVNATDAQCVRMVGPGNPYYVMWSLPASGFTLESFSTLASNRVYKPVTTNPSFFSGNFGAALINTNDLPVGGTAYFNMVERVYSQLLVLLPGESSAPGTLTGKSGTPAQQNTQNLVPVTVIAVDSQFYPVGGLSDSVKLTSSDGSAILPNPSSMTNGMVVFPTFLFQTDGTQTISAQDTTTTNNIPLGVSSSVVVAN